MKVLYSTAILPASIAHLTAMLSKVFYLNFSATDFITIVYAFS